MKQSNLGPIEISALLVTGAVMGTAAYAIAGVVFGGDAFDTWLNKWQTLIGAAFALLAAGTAWSIGSKQVAEQRANYLIQFLIEDKTSAEEHIESLHKIAMWIDDNLFLAFLVENEPAKARLWVIQSACGNERSLEGTDLPTLEDSYSHQWREKFISAAPKCSYPVWQIRFDKILHKVFNAGHRWDPDWDDPTPDNPDSASDDIRDSLKELEKFQEKVAAEVQRMQDVIEAYNISRNKLIEAAVRQLR